MTERRDSGDQVVNDTAMNIGQAEIAARVMIGQPFMIQAQQMQDSQGGSGEEQTQPLSEDQIEELVDNKTEKEKLRTRIRADLAERGASPENPEGYCTVGREEIAKDSAAGRLLRAR